MSRPFLIGLLVKGEIAFHYVGSHRRVVFRDLLEYEKNRDTARRAGMNDLLKKMQAAGLESVN